MEEIKIVIPLPPVTKKNHQQIFRNSRTGQAFVTPSEQYKRYERDCIPYLWRKAYLTEIDFPVNIKCLFYMPTRRRCDLTNLLEAIDDIMVKCRVIKDDCFTIVAGHDGSRVLYDKDHPRTEITITDMEDEI